MLEFSSLAVVEALVLGVPFCSLYCGVYSYLVVYPSFPPIDVVGAVSPVSTPPGSGRVKVQMVVP